MHDIRLTYFDSEVYPVIYILLFFRSVGIYVDERTVKKNADDFCKYSRNTENDCIDIVVANKDILFQLPEISFYNKVIFIINESYLTGNSDNIVVVRDGDTAGQILHNLIEKMYAADYLENDKEELFKIIKIYDKNNMMRTIMSTRFFYPSDQSYEIAYQYYREAVSALEAEGQRQNDILNEYTQLYWMYELNFYAKRMKKKCCYDAENLLFRALRLQKKNEKWCQCNLLVAQIYDDLIEDNDMACVYYNIAAEKEYCAFPWYKMGIMWQSKYLNFENAAACFKRARKIEPIYYKAIYREAECEYYMGNKRKALGLFKNVNDLLLQRKEDEALRPIDIEYMFKAYVNRGKIWLREFDITYNGIEMYLEAIDIWQQIERVGQTVQKNLKTDYIENLYKDTKKHINIQAVYRWVSEAYEWIGDTDRAEYYEKKSKVIQEDISDEQEIYNVR